MCPYNNNYITKDTFITFGASLALALESLRVSSLEVPGLHDSNLNTLSTQTPRGQELVGHVLKKSGKSK